MKRVIVVFLLFTAAIGAVLAYLTLTRPAPRAVDLLPESTLVFLDIPNFSQSHADFATTELYALWHEPEVQAFVRKPLKALREASSNAGAPSDSDSVAHLVLDAMQGEVFLALTHVTIFPSFSPGLILGVNVGHKRIQAAAGIYELEKRLKQTYPNGSFQDKKYLGVKYTVWETQPGYLICHASFSSLVIFTFGEDTMRDAIACYTGQAPPDFKRLSTSAKFMNVEAHAAKDHEFLAYLNVDEVVNLVGPLMALSPQTSGYYQKLQRIQASAVSMTFVDGGVEDVGFVAYSSDAPKPTPQTQRKTLSLTSPDTLLYSVGSADLSSAYEEGMQGLSQSGSAPVMSAVAQFEQALRTRGIHVRDALQQLGPELAIIGKWRTGARAPDFAVVSEVANVDQLRPAVDGIMNALKESALGNDDTAPWDEAEAAGQKLRTVHVGANLVAPTYTVADKFFILASTPDYARELLTQAKESKPTLATSTTYQQYMKRLPSNGSSYGYADLRGLFEPLYGLAKSGLSEIGSNEFVDIAKLPQSETIAKHLFPFASVTVSEQQQVTSTSFSPVGKSMAALLGIGGAVWVANEFGPQIMQATMSALPKKSSSTASPWGPLGNQTAPSQTPASP